MAGRNIHASSTYFQLVVDAGSCAEYARTRRVLERGLDRRRRRRRRRESRVTGLRTTIVSDREFAIARARARDLSEMEIYREIQIRARVCN